MSHAILGWPGARRSRPVRRGTRASLCCLRPDIAGSSPGRATPSAFSSPSASATRVARSSAFQAGLRRGVVMDAGPVQALALAASQAPMGCRLPVAGTAAVDGCRQNVPVGGERVVNQTLIEVASEKWVTSPWVRAGCRSTAVSKSLVDGRRLRIPSQGDPTTRDCPPSGRGAVRFADFGEGVTAYSLLTVAWQQLDLLTPPPVDTCPRTRR
jgi:hypothetical protein